MAASPVFAVTPRLAAASSFDIFGAQLTPISTVALTSGATYSVPNNATYMSAWLIGGGGGSQSNNASSFGGDSGAAAKVNYFVFSGQSVAYSVGAAGAINGNGGATTLTYRGVTTRANGGLQSANSTTTNTNARATFANSDSGALGNLAVAGSSAAATVANHEGLADAINLATGSSTHAYGQGALRVINGQAGGSGAVIVQFSQRGFPLLTGAATGTRIDEVRLHVDESNEATPVFGSLQLLLQNTATGITTVLHSWNFDGINEQPTPPPTTNNGPRWDDLVVRFDSLILPNTQWRTLLMDTRTFTSLSSLSAVPRWHVVMQGADL